MDIFTGENRTLVIAEKAEQVSAHHFRHSLHQKQHTSARLCLVNSVSLASLKEALHLFLSALLSIHPPKIYLYCLQAEKVTVCRTSAKGLLTLSSYYRFSNSPQLLPNEKTFVLRLYYAHLKLPITTASYFNWQSEKFVEKFQSASGRNVGIN